MTVNGQSTTKHNSKVLLFICLLILGGFVGTAYGGLNRWTGIGPEGGEIYSVVIDPSDPMTLYVATGDGIIKSTDGGASWQVATGLLPFTILNLTFDPFNPTILYAGGYDGVFKSIDAGANWQAINSGLPPNRIISALVVDPADSATLYAGTYDDGVFRSGNSGASWQAINTGLVNLSISALVIDPIDPDNLYVGTNDNSAFKISFKTLGDIDQDCERNAKHHRRCQRQFADCRFHSEGQITVDTDNTGPVPERAWDFGCKSGLGVLVIWGNFINQQSGKVKAESAGLGFHRVNSCLLVFPISTGSISPKKHEARTIL